MFSHLLLPFLVAMFLAINMGGSGTAPSFSSAYGAKLIRRDLIPGLFGIFVFLGAILAGKNVALTVGKGIVPSESLTIILTTIILLSVALSLLFANLLGIPQSTSQSTIFALVGAASYLNILKTDKLFYQIIPTWFILPIISFVLTYLITKFIYSPIRNRDFIRFSQLPKYPLFRWVVIFASCYVAFAIGSNNVANASGPIASMILNVLHIQSDGDSFILILILSTLIIAPCFGIGSSLFGKKVMRTTGREIVEFGPGSATIISVITASLLLLASVVKGIPTSLVQLNTFSIIAVGISKNGWKPVLGKKTVLKLALVWVIAPVIAFCLSYFLTFLTDFFGIIS
ncbi:MAG: inorganic phosphate transporter [Bacteroidales bacterium]|nr:inorganic phosphate transporter [Bacteroidales bacterium]